jgi:galactose mutarotase-like enzyme
MTATNDADWITIRSDRLTARINPLGAELSVLRDAEFGDLQWDGDPAIWHGRAPILFPVIGVVNQGEVHVDGRAYPMAKHGIARRRTFQVIEQNDASAVFRLEADAETAKSYPFDFRLDIAFGIARGALALDATLANRGDTPMPASFGFHPALRWPLPHEERAQHRILFDEAEADPIRRIDRDGLLTPTLHPTPIDGRTLWLRDDLFVDDAIILLTHRSRGLLYGVEGGRNLRIDFPQMPALGIWTKPGADFLCIEPWHGVADPEGFTGDLAAKPGMAIVPPHQTINFTMRIAYDD